MAQLIENILKKADQHIKAGEFSQAASLYKNILHKYPENKRANLILKKIKNIQQKTFFNDPPKNFIDELINYHRLGFYKDLINNSLKLYKHYPESYTLNNLIAAGYTGLKQYNKAINHYEKAININKYASNSYLNLGNLYSDLKKFKIAEKYYNKALSIDPKNAILLNNLGLYYSENNKMIKSLRFLKKALLLNSNYEDALINIANTYKYLGGEEYNFYSRSIFYYRKLIRLNSNNFDAQYNLSILLLYLGEFSSGWKSYSKRWSSKKYVSYELKLKIGKFNLENKHKKCLIWPEQSLGYQILFARLFNDLRDKDIKIDALVDKKLKPLFQSSFPHINFVDSANEDLIDSHAPMGDLGQFFINNFDDVKARSHPYIKVNQQKEQTLKKLLPSDKKICGISWVSVNEDLGRNKSMSLEQLKDILLLPNMVFVDLQYGDTSQERQSFYEKYGVKILKIEEVDNFDDIEGLASLIDLCDCVLSVSNTTVHIAGAIGKPTYLMLPKGKGKLWYWSKEGNQSIWYKSIKIFEQDKIGEWDGLVKNVKKEMLDKCTSTQISFCFDKKIHLCIQI